MIDTILKRSYSDDNKAADEQLLNFETNKKVLLSDCNLSIAFINYMFQCAHSLLLLIGGYKRSTFPYDHVQFVLICVSVQNYSCK